jgi:hypothetical protein
MEPHTAKNLRERKQNKLKDFIHVAGPLGAPRAAPPPRRRAAPQRVGDPNG